MKPHIHAESSVKKFGGKAEDYVAIHEFIDCSKGVVADHRHRALTHNTWFIMNVLPRVFGATIMVGTGKKRKKVSVRDIGEHHVLEDYRGKFIPSAQDFLQCMEYHDWMNNGESGHPSSCPAPKTPMQAVPNHLGDIFGDWNKPHRPIIQPIPHLPGGSQVYD